MIQGDEAEREEEPDILQSLCITVHTFTHRHMRLNGKQKLRTISYKNGHRMYLSRGIYLL